jgi:hypothetical protein
VILRLEERPQYQLGLHHRALALISDNSWRHALDRIQSLPGCMHLCFPAENGQSYRVEASSDLRNWESVFAGTGIDGTLHFAEDQMQDFDRRFYRLTPEPAPLPHN